MTSSGRIAILGAGPIGIEAALAAGEAGLPFTVYEASGGVAGNVAAWGHVRMFTPWSLVVSARLRAALARAGHGVPAGDHCPTGRELIDRVLAPVASGPRIAPHLRLGERVLAVGREGLLKHEEIGTARRRAAAFRLLVRGHDGRERIEQADVVLDCTGSYDRPHSTGTGGIPAPGEAALGSRIRRFLPDFAPEADDWAGRTILLVGSGHSAQTAARDLARLAGDRPRTPPRTIWIVRRERPRWNAIENDPLPERAELAASAAALAGGSSPHVETRLGSSVEGFALEGDRIRVHLAGRSGARDEVLVDRVLSLVGGAGDHLLYRQLQVHECYATEGPMRLAAVLLGSGGDCLAQTSHGADALRNPEPGFFVLGSKSYGRNATFLLRVGWEQVDEALALVAQRAVPGADRAVLGAENV